MKPTLSPTQFIVGQHACRDTDKCPWATLDSDDSKRMDCVRCPGDASPFDKIGALTWEYCAYVYLALNPDEYNEARLTYLIGGDNG